MREKWFKKVEINPLIWQKSPRNKFIEWDAFKGFVITSVENVYCDFKIF